MTGEETARAFMKAVEQKDLDTAFGYVAEEFQFYGPRVPPLTKTAYNNNLIAVVGAFDEWQYNPGEFRTDDSGRLHTRIQVTGVQNRELAFPGAPVVPATGKRYNRPEEPLAFDVVDGQIQAMHMTPSGDKPAIYDIVDDMSDD